MNTIYNKIGNKYSVRRCTDPKIESQIHKELLNSTMILNIGAGTGSYEPIDKKLVAVEPSIEMIRQRSEKSHPVKQAKADFLPFSDKYFSHTMTILSMHHWEKREKAYLEIKRVTRDKFIAITWFPELASFWLTKDYFPEIYEIDTKIFPSINELNKHFNNIEIKPLLIPDDCRDGFLACFWKRPEAYLDSNVRLAMSTFSKIKYLDDGLNRLKNDIESGLWHKKNIDLLNSSYLDVGYRIITVDLSANI